MCCFIRLQMQPTFVRLHLPGSTVVIVLNTGFHVSTFPRQESCGKFGTRCCHQIPRISYKDHATNEEVRAKIQQAIGPHEEPDHRKETQTAEVWTCLPFTRSGQKHLARHSEREKKTRQTEEEAGRQHQGMDRPGVRQVPEGSEEQGKIEENGCETFCGTTTTLAIKGLMR